MPDKTVEQRIVEMRIDNRQFESGANKTLGTLDKLDKGLNNLGNNGFEGLNASLDKITHRFSALGIAGDQVIRRITDSVVNLERRIVQMTNSLTLDQIGAGWTKFEQKTASVQTIMNATGRSVEEVEDTLAKLMWYSDETSFAFTDMTSALAQMTSSGGDIDKLVPLLMGVGNAVGFAGKGAAEFSRAIYNLNQSYGMGYLTYMDWRSFELAGVASQQLKQTIIDTAVGMGKISEGAVDVGNFASTLKDKWADREVMEEAFGYFAEISEKAKELVDNGYAANATEAYEMLADEFEEIQVRAAKAAQEAKSFKEVVEATADAASSRWLGIFNLIFGNYEQARDLWTDVLDPFWDVFVAPLDKLTDIAEVAFGTVKDMGDSVSLVKVVSLTDALQESGKSLADFHQAFRKVNSTKLDSLLKEYGSLEVALQNGAIGAGLLEKILHEMALQDEAAGLETAQTYERILDRLLNGKEVDATKFAVGSLEEAMAKAGRTLGDFEKAFAEVDSVRLNEIQAEYDSLDEALKSGAISAKLFHDILQQMASKDAPAGLSEGAADLDQQISKYEEVAYQILHGDFGVGEARKEMLEAAGYNAEIAQLFADLIVGPNHDYPGVDLKETLAWYKPEVLIELAKAAGFSEEQIAALNEMLEDSDALLYALQYSADGAAYGLISGGELFRDSIRNIGTFIQQIAGSVSEAIDMVFGSTEDRGNALYDLIYRFYEFTEGLVRIDETTGEASESIGGLTAALIPVLSVFRTIGTVLGVVFNIAKNVIGVIADLVGTVVGLVSNSTAVQHFGESFSMLFDILMVPIGIIIELFNSFREALAGFAESKAGQMISGYLTVLALRFEALITKIHTFLTDEERIAAFTQSIKDAFKNGGFLGVIWEMLTKIAAGLGLITDKVSELGAGDAPNVFQRIGAALNFILDGLFGGPEKRAELQQKVTDFVDAVWKGLIDGLKSIKFADLVDAFRAGTLAALVLRIAKSLNVFDGITEGIEDIPKNINKVFRSMQNTFKDLAANFRVDAILKVAAAIVAVTLALIALAFVPQDKLMNAASILVVIMIVMARIAKQLRSTNITGSNNSIDVKQIQVIGHLGSTLIGIGVLLIGISVAMVKIGSILKENDPWYIAGILAIMVAAIALIVGGAVILMRQLDKISKMKRIDAVGKNTIRIAEAMVIIGIAVGLLIQSALSVAKASAKYGSSNVANAVILIAIVVVGIMAGLALLVYALRGGKSNATSPDKIEAIGSTIVKMAAAILLIGLGLTLMMAPLLILVALYGSLKDTNVISNAAGIVAILAFIMFALIAGIYLVITSRDASPEKISAAGSSMLRIAASMAIIAVALTLMVIPIILIGAACKALGASMGMGLVVMAGLVALIAVLAAIGGSKKMDAKKLLVFAAAIAIFALALNLLIPVLIGMGVAGAMIGKQVKNFKDFAKVALVMALLAALLLVFGAGATLTGLGLLLVAAGLLVLAVAMDKVSTAFPNFIEGLIKTGDMLTWKNMLPIVKATAILLALGVACYFLGKGIASIMKNGGLKDSFGKLGEGLGNVAKSIIELIGKIGKAMAELFVKNIPSILKFVGGLLVVAGLYILDILPNLVDFLGQAFFALLEGFYLMIQTNRGALEHSIFGVVSIVMNVLYDALIWGCMMIWPMLVKTIGDAFLELIHSIIPDNWWKKLSTLITNGQSDDLTAWFDESVQAKAEEQAARSATMRESSGTFFQTIIPEAQQWQSIKTNPLYEQIFGTKEDRDQQKAEALEDVQEAAGEMQTNVTETIAATGGDLADTFTEATGTAMTDGIPGVADSIETLVEDAETSSESSAFSAGTKLGNNGIVDGIANGFVEGFPKLTQLMTDGANSLTGTFAGALEIASPSKVFMRLASWIPVGIAKGLDETAGEAEAASVGLANSISQAAEDAMLQVATVADEDFTYSPTITPVVDTSNIDSAAGYMGTRLGGNYSVNADVDRAVRTRLGSMEQLAASMRNAGDQVTNYDNITVNVYPTPGQSAAEIADNVISQISARLLRRGVAFG